MNFLEIKDTIPDEIADGKINFNLKHWVERGNFGYKRFTGRRYIYLEDKLSELTSCTVAQFEFRKGFQKLKGPKRKWKLAPDPNLSADVTDLGVYEFRLGSKYRVFGYFDNPIFYICWVDPEHKATST